MNHYAYPKSITTPEKKKAYRRTVRFLQDVYSKPNSWLTYQNNVMARDPRYQLLGPDHEAYVLFEVLAKYDPGISTIEVSLTSLSPALQELLTRHEGVTQGYYVYLFRRESTVFISRVIAQPRPVFGSA